MLWRRERRRLFSLKWSFPTSAAAAAQFRSWSGLASEGQLAPLAAKHGHDIMRKDQSGYVHWHCLSGQDAIPTTTVKGNEGDG